MKYRFILPLLLLFGLIAAPDAAFAAASRAALLWWTRVLPSLLPYLIAAAMLARSDLFCRLPKRFVPPLLPVFGLLGGYPVGARLSGTLCRNGALSRSDAQKAAAFCNLPNPVFLISVVSAGFFHDPRTAPPLLLGVCGASLFGLVPLLRIRFSGTYVSGPASPAKDLPDAIGEGVRAILNIGGCIVFASVLGALIDATGVFRLFGANAATVRAILLGLFEMTSGANAIAALPLSLPLRLALCAFCILFGGLSVALQSAADLPLSLPRYLFCRLPLAVSAALAVYVLTPLFCPDAAVPTLAEGRQMLRNAFDLFAVSVSAAFGLLLVFVFTCGLNRKRTPRSERSSDDCVFMPRQRR